LKEMPQGLKLINQEGIVRLAIGWKKNGMGAKLN